MSRLTLPTALTVIGLCWPSSALAQTSSAPPRLAASVSSCETGLRADDRAAVFTGAMRQIRKATTMAMRFDLYVRSSDSGPFTRVKVPGFDTWLRSQADAAGFVYDKRVEQLDAPAAYRVLVRFRWYDAGGRAVRSTQRTSDVCLEPDLRPDLRVEQLLVGAVRRDGTAPYTVTVRNTGATAVTAPFTTAITVDGIALAPQSITALPVDGSATLSFSGPRCAAGVAVVATVDADAAVDEANETDDTARKSCPEAP